MSGVLKNSKQVNVAGAQRFSRECIERSERSQEDSNLVGP